MGDTSTNPTESLLDFAALLNMLGFTEGEFVALGWEKPDGFRTAVMTPSDAAAAAGETPAAVDLYFGVNPVRGPARRNAGRGTETDVTRLAALWADLDAKPTGCGSLDVAHTVIDDLSTILGTRPSVVVESGHGLHPYWPVADGRIYNGHIGPARALVKRWGRLVAVAAGNRNAHVDNVFDLPRMLRVPGTFNNKAA